MLHAATLAGNTDVVQLLLDMDDNEVITLAGHIVYQIYYGEF